MGDSRRRRLIASCLCFCLLLLGAGCSEKDTQEGDIVLEFWTIALGDAFADYINGMIADYEELNPGVRVEWVDVSGGEVAEKFIAALVSGDPPDLANVYDLPRFLEHDVLSNLDSLVSGTDQDRYLPNFWRGMGQYQGANYAFPFYGSVNMMWYNKEIFAAAGLDPERPPTTMTEMFEMGRVIREKTGKYGVSWRLHPSLVGPPWWLLRMDDVWPLFNPDGTATTINNAEALALFEQWVDAYAMGVLPPEALAASSRDEVNWFIEGRAAMLPFSGGWITRYFDESFETKAGMTSHPLGRLGKVPANSQVLVVPRMSPHVEQAVDFGLFVTSPKYQLEFCSYVAILPTTKEAAADPFFRQPPRNLSDRANQISFADLPNSFVAAPPDVKGWSRMEDILYEEFARALAGQQSSQAALDRIESKWNHLLRYTNP